MSMQKVGADLIFTNRAGALESGVIVLDSQDKIVAIDHKDDHDPSSVKWYQGAIVPGYVNAHCHLELSHMLDRIPSGTGLVSFIKAVVSDRDHDPAIIEQAIYEADQLMCENGIVAVGDICNTTDSLACKEESDLRYYSFVEMFDFMNSQVTQQVFDQYKQVFDMAIQTDRHQVSAVPHAPYSVSKDLYEKINTLNEDPGSVSIHHMETEAEINLFRLRQSAFVDLFHSFGQEMQIGADLPKSATQQLMNHLDHRHRTLLVHNTLIEEEDIRLALQYNDETFFVTCPNANLYIENRLPNYRTFLDTNTNVCLGTDSLSSNWTLSIFEEMKTIAKYQSYVPLEALVRWSSINGAHALGLGNQLGLIDVGKRPGLNHVTLNHQGKLTTESRSTKIV